MFKISLYFFSLFFINTYSDDIDYDQLKYTNGLLYKKEINEIFTGNVTGIQNGKVVNGLKEGEWKGFYENGNLLWSGFYNNGLNVSKWVEYHNNGKVFTMGHYENGQKIGVWSFYDKHGKKIADEIYKNNTVTTKIYK